MRGHGKDCSEDITGNQTCLRTRIETGNLRALKSWCWMIRWLRQKSSTRIKEPRNSAATAAGPLPLRVEALAVGEDGGHELRRMIAFEPRVLIRLAACCREASWQYGQ
jgi:hypothetical protein